MRPGDAESKKSLPQPGQHGPDRAQAWRQLTYDYLRYLLGQLDDVMGSLQAQDHVNVQQIAHRAKGTSGTYGLRPIAEKFARLEQAAGYRPQEDIPGIVTALRQLIGAEIERLRPCVGPSAHDDSGDTNG